MQAGTTGVQSHGYFISNGLYDCQVFQPTEGTGGYWTYVSSYQFNPDGTYAEAGARVGRQLQSPVTTGSYQVSGDKVIPSSGILMNDHDYMLIENTDLHVASDDGRLSGLNCILIYPKPPAPAPVLTLGTYTCVNTVVGKDPLQPTYYTSQVVTKELTFFSDGTYQPSALTTRGNWHLSGNTIVFSSGPFWADGALPQHDVGILHSPGVLMPRAAYPFDPNTPYTLVIRDTRPEGAVPPFEEFTNNDGPSGSYTGEPQSWFYCNKS